ncbi:MAG: hypothetical protein AAGU74_09310 [Bacillota bacterium]
MGSWFNVGASCIPRGNFYGRGYTNNLCSCQPGGCFSPWWNGWGCSNCGWWDCNNNLNCGWHSGCGCGCGVNCGCGANCGCSNCVHWHWSGACGWC